MNLVIGHRVCESSSAGNDERVSGVFDFVCVRVFKESGRGEKPVVHGSSCNLLRCNKGSKCAKTPRFFGRNQLVGNE